VDEDVWEEIEEMVFFKCGARSQWDKNKNLAFLGANIKYISPHGQVFTSYEEI